MKGDSLEASSPGKMCRCLKNDSFPNRFSGSHGWIGKDYIEFHVFPRFVKIALPHIGLNVVILALILLKVTALVFTSLMKEIYQGIRASR
jgi:hypothetical protein